MKKIKQLVAAIFATVFATSTFASGLLPADHEICQADDQMIVSCAEGSEFLLGDDGRCGCVESYIPARTCMVAMIKCSENAPFTSLYSGGEYVGCGCFETISAQ